MRVQTEEWRRFIPGIRMYNGKKTLFYNGEKLRWEGGQGYYNKKERNTWEVIIVLPGVEIIRYCTLDMCRNVKMVIMADAVKRIEEYAFFDCSSLVFVKLSRNLEYIEFCAFHWCKSLALIFIPPSCREIGDYAFLGCTKLIILSIARHTTLGRNVIPGTALIEVSPFETNENGDYHGNNAKVNEWIQNLNQNDEYALHRECASFQPSENDIYEIIKRQGLQFINVKNQIGLTAFECLQKNPYTDVEIDEQKLINKFVLDLLGEIIA
ncbi:hypothetical protein CTEN210_09007 [Chaetoceros tenuissimus]|uniref:Leucine-rich repeat domain-containing protein n=1 Tax=Chaetoceros tenuissimus TaxID=426638 RepID=A0AAD3H6Y8_9STRA|nr:hypothetical protein CTEN210_09007 [Chaetoceros tenuissimus]